MILCFDRQGSHAPRLLRNGFLALAASAAVLGLYADRVPAQEYPATSPSLVTFGPAAQSAEGDHDHQQVIRIRIPADAGSASIRIFDPDTGNRHDEPQRGFNSRTRFRLYGDGVEVVLARDGNGVIQETVSGEPLASREFGFDPEYDGKWISLFEIEAGSGKSVGNGEREFLVVAEGAAGNDGNVFELAVTSEGQVTEGPGTQLERARLFSYLPTFQVPADRAKLIELRFHIPQETSALRISNFDGAGATVEYAGRFRLRPLEGSGKSEWETGVVKLASGEAGGPGSVTARSGEESPNDMTVFVEAERSGDREPLPVELPLRIFDAKPRPRVSLGVEQIACGLVELDATGTHDAAGRALAYRWIIDDGEAAIGPNMVQRRFDAGGIHRGRLEVTFEGEQVGNGVGRDFAFLVKQPPIADFDAPALAAEIVGGTEIRFDGRRSQYPALPRGNRITRYEWDFGDGTSLAQEEDDADFGMPAHHYAEAGNYTVKLRVTDIDGHPCSEAVAERTLAINSAPVAEAGPDLRVAPGEKITFDGGEETDDDGDELRFQWDFGDGSGSTQRRSEHSYQQLGKYVAMLTVDDGRGAANSIAADEVEIFVNSAPDASSVVIPETLVEGEPGTFRSSPAVDSDGRIVSREWDFGNGDRSNTADVRRTFFKPGQYPVRLELRDDAGLSNSQVVVERVVTVTPAVNQPPVAVTDGDRATNVNSEITFDGSASRDPDGSILTYEWDFGDGRTASGIRTRHVYRQAGHYTASLTVTDDSGKENSTASVQFEIEVGERNNVAPIAEAGGDRAADVGEVLSFDASASSDPDGTITAISWDFGDGVTAKGRTARHSYRQPGEYHVKVEVRDDSGLANNRSQAQFTVSVDHARNAAPQVSIASDVEMETGVSHVFDASGAEDPDGEITSFLWDFGDGAKSNLPVTEHAYAEAGEYSGMLVMTDDSGLESGRVEIPFTASVVERRNIPPVAEAGEDREILTGESLTLDGGNSSDRDGSILRYDWDFGNGKAASGERRDIAYFVPGEYVVKLTVTDNSGQGNATAEDSLTVTVTDPANEPPIAVVQEDRPAAIEEAVPFTAARSRDPDGNILSYEWDFGDGAKAAGREVSHAYSGSGIYEARLTVRDDSGLANDQASAVRRIVVNQPPVAEAGPDRYVTASQVRFDASASRDSDGQIIDYQWDFGDGQTGVGQSIVHTYRSPGTYPVTLTVTDGSGTIRNTHSDGMQVRINALPVADAGFDLVTAPDQTITLDGRRSFDPDGEIRRYSWDFRDGNRAEGDVVTHAYEKPGTYIVELTVEDDSGHPRASDFSQIRVTVNAQPIANAGPDISVAPGQSFMLSGLQSNDPDGEITGWRWDIAETDEMLEGAEIEHRFDEPGIYTASLTVTDDSSATNRTARDETTIQVNHKPVAEAGPDQFAGGLRIVFDAGKSADPDGDGLTYVWNFGDGQNARGEVVEHVYETGGVYPVLLAVDDGKGLANSSDNDAMTVRINRPPVAVAGENRQACVGDVVVFDGSYSQDPDGGLLEYAWSFGDGKTSQLVNPTKIYPEPGTYQVRLQVTDESGLSNAGHVDELLVDVEPAPVANAGPDIEACAGTPVRFDGSKSIDIDGVVNRFSWDFGDGNSGGGDKPEHVYSQPGTYRASLQIEGDNLGICSPVSTDDLVVTVRDAPTAEIIAPDAVAQGQSVTFDASGSTVRSGEIISFDWDFDDGTSEQGAITTHSFDEPGVYQVRLATRASADIGGCEGAEALHAITVNAAPVADAGPDRTIEAGWPLQLSASRSNDSDGGIASYSWDFGDGTQADGLEVRKVWREPGRYEIALSVDDGNGLPNSVSTDRITVDVTPRPPIEIEAIAAACPGEPVEFALANLPRDIDGVDWRFGDGGTASGPSVSHAYERGGEYAVGANILVTRAGEVISTPLAHTLRVNREPAPVVIAPRKTCAGMEIVFDATKSVDHDDGITRFSWDFGDGKSASGARVAHVYDAPGTYQARLRVTDASGTACGTRVVTYPVFVNSPPQPDAGPDFEVMIGGAADVLVLDASRSQDPDGDNLDYFWELSSGDLLDGEKVRMEDIEAGDFTAKLTAFDSHGLACSEATDTIRIRARLREQSTLLEE